MQRREFLKVLATGATAAALPACGGWGVNAPRQVNASAPDLAGRVSFARDAYPELGTVGGSVLVLAAGTNLPLLVMRTSEDEYRATSGLCTHVRCPVGYVPSQGYIECPCHGARFGLDGHVIRKPATTGLTPFPVRVDPDTDELYVDTRGTDVPAMVDGKIEFAVDDAPDLALPDSFYTFTPTGMDRPIIVIRYETRRIFAADATCTFARCVLDYSVDRRRYRCPCHGCEFDLADGTVREGPATQPLRVLPAEFDGTTVRLTVPA